MKPAIYEYHTSKHYTHPKIPFIFHKDTVSNGYDDRYSCPHWHENLEFLRCHSGKGTVLLDAVQVAFHPDDIITVNSNSTHTIFNNNDITTHYDCLIIDTGFCKENGINVEDIQFDAKIMDKDALRLYDEAFDACSSTETFYTLFARTKVLNFLLYMCQMYSGLKEKTASDWSITHIKKSMSFIKNNYKDKITLEQAAAVSGFSVYYFSREFKKVTGQTFTVFLNTVRCEKAVQMLKAGATVTEACFACGFKELGYFSRTFKKIKGISPSQIQNKSQTNSLQ